MKRWDELESLFHDALDLDGAARADFVARIAADDPPTARRLAALLDAHSGAAGAFLAPQPFDLDHEDEDGTALVGTRLGEFTLKRVIGRGGMGLVYEAEQERPRRSVALKVMRRGVAGANALKRFELEAETLGRLRHPGIAQVFAAGTRGEDGERVPWFAMEFVEDARSLTHHAAERGLTVPERLELFRQVCDAVAYGHRKGVIHRDLKPGNVLVDGAGRPKVIDFGVARTTDADLTLTTAGMDERMIVGTLSTMSPEQCAGDTAAIDTRSDVYSLGALLFELLTGTRAHELDGVSLPEALRIVREEPARRLRSVDPSLAGDLETIVERALAKDAGERYATANDLARDVGHFLASEPIEARPHGALYRLRLLARRHRVASAAVAVLVPSLIGGIVATSWGWSAALDARDRADRAATLSEALRLDAVAAREEADRSAARSEELRLDAVAARDEADREARRARALSDFLLDVIQAPSPYQDTRIDGEYARTVPLVWALDAGVTNMERRFGDDPELELQLRYAFGKSYADLGRLEDARVHVARAAEIVAGLDDPDPQELTEVELARAVLHHRRGEIAEARALLDAAWARVLETDAPDQLFLDVGKERARNLLRSGESREAEVLCEDLIEASTKRFGANHVNTLALWNDLGRIYDRAGRHTEACALYERLFDLHLDELGEEHGNTVAVAGNLARAYGRIGMHDRAYSLGEIVVDYSERVFGNDDDRTYRAYASYGEASVSVGDLAQGETYLRAAFEGLSELLGPTHRDTLEAGGNLAVVHLVQGRPADGAALLEQIVDGALTAHPEDERSLGMYRVNLAGAYVELGRYDEASELLDVGLPALERALGPENPEYLQALETRRILEKRRGR